jgi:hypothetical protein
MPNPDPGVLPGDFPGGPPNVRPFGPGIGNPIIPNPPKSGGGPSLVWDGVTREIPDCSHCSVDCLEWAWCLLKISNSNNPLHDFCCNGSQQGFAICPQISIEASECCKNCYCLQGDPSDPKTARGCLCGRTSGMTTNHWPGDPDYTQLVLQIREKCGSFLFGEGLIEPIKPSCLGLPNFQIGNVMDYELFSTCKLTMDNENCIIEYIMPTCLEVCQFDPFGACEISTSVCLALCTRCPASLKDKCFECCGFANAYCEYQAWFWWRFGCNPFSKN